MVKIAVDMMGGDDAPGIVLDAVKKAVEDFKDLEIILFGDKEQYNLNHDRIDFRHCSEKIEMEDEPVRAIKRKKDSSMVKMAEAVKSGEAHGCVSAGNTGALMSAGLFCWSYKRCFKTCISSYFTNNGWKGLCLFRCRS